MEGMHGHSPREYHKVAEDGALQGLWNAIDFLAGCKPCADDERLQSRERRRALAMAGAGHPVYHGHHNYAYYAPQEHGKKILLTHDISRFPTDQGPSSSRLSPRVSVGNDTPRRASAKDLARDGGDKAVPHVERCVVPVLGGAMVSLQSPIHVMLNEDDGISAAGYLQAENDRLKYENQRLRLNLEGAASAPRTQVLYPVNNHLHSAVAAAPPHYDPVPCRAHTSSR